MEGNRILHCDSHMLLDMLEIITVICLQTVLPRRCGTMSKSMVCHQLDVMHRRMLACGGAKPAKSYVEDLLHGGDRTKTLVGVKASSSETVTGHYPDFHAYLKDMGILRHGGTAT